MRPIGFKSYEKTGKPKLIFDLDAKSNSGTYGIHVTDTPTWTECISKYQFTPNCGFSGVRWHDNAYEFTGSQSSPDKRTICRDITALQDLTPKNGMTMHVLLTPVGTNQGNVFKFMQKLNPDGEHGASNDFMVDIHCALRYSWIGLQSTVSKFDSSGNQIIILQHAKTDAQQNMKYMCSITVGNNLASIYVNGVLQAQASVDSNDIIGQMRLCSYAMMCSSNSARSNEWLWTGKVHFAKVFNKCFSNKEVLDFYNSNIGY